MSIFKTVQDLLKTHEPALSTDKSSQLVGADLRVATAVLLLETAYGDTDYAQREHKTIQRSLEREFGIGRKAAQELIRNAEWSRPAKGDFSKFTNLLKEHYDEEQRTRVLALVWKVVEADGEVQEFEQVFAEYLTELVGLSAEQGSEARAMAERGEV